MLRLPTTTIIKPFWNIIEFIIELLDKRMSRTCVKYKVSNSSEGPNVLQDVRLVDGVGLYDGRIEVLYNGTWGTICRNNYRYQNSVVICRMLGASRQEETTRFGAGSGPIHFENLYCQGSETDLSQCTVDVEHTCSHSLDAEYRRPLNITGVRLADGTSQYDGRVELEENGVWGSVCHHYFDFNDGNTLCRMMNMSNPGTGIPSTLKSVIFFQRFCKLYQKVDKKRILGRA
ncbi:DMBT1-like protein [Mya arenaria]|uniref:DMBT1-like protein n=1 Tax=Mya arenaria TaxID=6604 RepID=A0ABY7FHC8_MYAAR|nr:DMBT1-like protein [Mya arenaria]